MLRYFVWISILACTAIAASGCAQTAPPSRFSAYENCHFNDGLAVADLAPLAPGITSRTVETRHGREQVEMEEGRRIMFGYPNTDFFANVKVERLPAGKYGPEKQVLIDAFDKTLADSPDAARNYSLSRSLNGFEIYGLDRGKLEGGVLAIYLFFDDTSNIATTIYLLNQDPVARKFKTIEEFHSLRDGFLKAYTQCIRTSQIPQKR